VFVDRCGPFPAFPAHENERARALRAVVATAPELQDKAALLERLEGILHLALRAAALLHQGRLLGPQHAPIVGLVGQCHEQEGLVGVGDLRDLVSP
jgi:hypothetical protein